MAIDTIRALSIDAIEKQILDTLVYQWELPLWRIHYGHVILILTPNLKIILIEIDSFFQQDMALLLLYSLLHVSGSLELEELKQFRQWGSKTQVIQSLDIQME